MRVPRRSVLRSALGVGVGLALGPVSALGQDDVASTRPQPGDRLVKVADGAAMPLAAEDVAIGTAPLLAWAVDPISRAVRSGSRFGRVLLVRLDAASLAEETKSMAASGVVAYTPSCTHSGCDVADWLADEQVLYCPCHASKFDPKAGGRVVDGPAPRSLPALPLKIENGMLVVAGPFSARVGFESA